MRNELLELTRDTLAYLRVEKKTEPPPPPPAPPKKVETEVVVPTPPPRKKPLPSEKVGEPMHKLIGKHLPHLLLKEEIPSMHRVAIVYLDEDALPFLENIARAIRERFCPVELVPMEKTLESYSHVLAPKGSDVKADIWLEPIADYQNNRDLKKELWSTICQKLSPKSS